MVNISLCGKFIGLGFGEQGNQVIVLGGNKFHSVIGGVGKCC